MVMRKILIAAALAGALATPAAAEKLEPRAMLVASTPARDSVVAAGTATIELSFAEPAEVLSVSLRLPDDSEMTAEPEAGARPGSRPGEEEGDSLVRAWYSRMLMVRASVAKTENLSIPGVISGDK